ncbi:MAG TPA: hypothetical protein VIP46_07505 [Pyrinomonadaceae bacterium]
MTNPDTNQNPQNEGADEKRDDFPPSMKRRGRMDLALYAVGAVAALSAIGVAAVSAYNVKHKETYILWLSYFGFVVVLLGVALFLQKRIWEHEGEVLASQMERAYMGISSSFVVDFTPGQQALAVLTVDNAGKTPASEVRYNARFDIRPPNSPLDWSTVAEPPPASASSFVLPGRSIVLPIKFPIEATGELFDAINKEQLIVVIYGMIFFKDASGNPHAVEFCRFYRASRNALTACGTNNREIY